MSDKSSPVAPEATADQEASTAPDGKPKWTMLPMVKVVALIPCCVAHGEGFEHRALHLKKGECQEVDREIADRFIERKWLRGAGAEDVVGEISTPKK